MKIAVRYYTKTGNTKRLAEALAKELGVKALPVTEPITEPVFTAPASADEVSYEEIGFTFVMALMAIMMSGPAGALIQF